jgi:hypothetical protein
MTKANFTIEFRCPECGCQDEFPTCEHRQTKKDEWRIFVLVRRFVSKLDYDYYRERESKQ